MTLYHTRLSGVVTHTSVLAHSKSNGKHHGAYGSKWGMQSMSCKHVAIHGRGDGRAAALCEDVGGGGDTRPGLRLVVWARKEGLQHQTSEDGKLSSEDGKHLLKHLRTEHRDMSRTAIDQRTLSWHPCGGDSPPAPPSVLNTGAVSEGPGYSSTMSYYSLHYEHCNIMSSCSCSQDRGIDVPTASCRTSLQARSIRQPRAANSYSFV